MALRTEHICGRQNATHVFEAPALYRAHLNVTTGRGNQTGADLIVQSVIPGAPAEKAGMKAGDIIVKVDGNDVTGQTVDQVVGAVPKSQLKSKIDSLLK